jgi:hypothetical protein
MNWAIGAGTVAAVLAISGGSWAMLRRRVRARIDSAEQAAAAASQRLPGFQSAGAVLAVDGAAGLAVSTTDRVALVMQAGKEVLVREITWRALRSTPAGMVVETGDRRLGDVALAGVDVLEVRRLAPHPVRH